MGLKIAVYELQARLERSGAAALVVYRLEFLAIKALESLANLLFGAEHACRMSLHYNYSIIIIYYQPGQAIPLSMHQSITICLA